MSLDKYSFDDNVPTRRERDPWGSLRTFSSFGNDDTPTNPTRGSSWDTSTFPSWDPATGMGTPDSGYGPGGVTNPAYTGVGSPQYVPPGGAPGTPGGPPLPPPPLMPTPQTTGGGTQQPPNGDWRGWFMGLTGGKAPNPSELQAMEAQLAQYGVKVLKNARGWADKIQLPDGSSYDVIEAATANGGKRWQWLADAATVDGQARGLMSSLSADGYDVQSDGLNALIVDGRRYLVNQPNRPTWESSFAGQTPYTPTAMTMDDLQGLGYQDVRSRLTTPVSGATDDLVLSILRNPESLSDQMVSTLKARNADELADIARADDADLMRFGFGNNLGDSPWLASERRGAQLARDRALISSNRDIDITAAQTRIADRRQAAALGGQQSAEQRARETLATDVGLRQAAEKKDRVALNESFKQKAAELQINVDSLKLDYTKAMMDDITRRWGIRVSADIDWARIAQQGSQFKDELIFKMSELDQQLRLGYDKLAFDYRDSAANREQRDRLALLPQP